MRNEICGGGIIFATLLGTMVWQASEHLFFVCYSPAPEKFHLYYSSLSYQKSSHTSTPKFHHLITLL